MPTILTITSDTIQLPKRLAKKWYGFQAELSDQGIRVLRSSRQTSRLNEWRKLKPLTGRITQREIARVIASVRSK